MMLDFSCGVCCWNFCAFRSIILPSCLVPCTSRAMLALTEYKGLSGAIGNSSLKPFISNL